MIILGIDPGIATVGIGVVDATEKHALRAVDWCTLQTKANLPIGTRLCELAQDMCTILTEHKPDLAIMERIYFANNAQSAIDVAQARGVLLQAVAATGIPVLEATPLQLKAAITGDGQADKRQVQDMLVRILHLQEIPTPDDAADALALAVYGTLAHMPQI